MDSEETVIIIEKGIVMKKYFRIVLLLSFICFVIVSLSNYSLQGSEHQIGEGQQWTPQLGREPKQGDHYVNPKDGYVMVWIPSGEFYMGNNKGDKDERPKHKVEVEGFWLGKYELTNAQYARFLQTADQWHKTPFLEEKEYNSPKQPVAGIRFYDAIAYCQWANLRIPTEAEWEYAACGGKQMKYPTRNGRISHSLANFLGKKGRDKWVDRPAPVGSFPSNPFGLFDMAGNVWEWTSSLYQYYPYNAGDGRENMHARDYRVLRGGSWGFPKNYCKTTHRKYFDMHLRYDYAGMRLVKDFHTKR